MDAELGRHLLQGLAALLEPLDRLGLVLGGEPPPLALLRHPPLPVLVEPTLRRCPSSQGRLNPGRPVDVDGREALAPLAADADQVDDRLGAGDRAADLGLVAQVGHDGLDTFPSAA